jgi:hypothetical protein
MKKLIVKKRRASSFALWVGFIVAIAFGGTPVIVIAQNTPAVVGDWSGMLNPGAQPKKRIVVHISAAQDGSLSGTIDYPDQDTSGILITSITYSKSALHFESKSSLTFYDGTMSPDKSKITGTMKQANESLDLVLTRTP